MCVSECVCVRKWLRLKKVGVAVCVRGRGGGREIRWTHLGELELGVVWVHRLHLLLSGRAQHLDDFYKLVNARVAREQGVPQQQLRRHATRAPHVDRLLRGARARYAVEGGG